MASIVAIIYCIFRHIFLGFSKNGHFVLSYTFHVEADEHTAYPIYVYRLQWWRFRPYKLLKKVNYAINLINQYSENILLYALISLINLDINVHFRSRRCVYLVKRKFSRIYTLQSVNGQPTTPVFQSMDTGQLSSLKVLVQRFRGKKMNAVNF